MNNNKTCEIWGAHSSVDEDSVFWIWCWKLFTNRHGIVSQKTCPYTPSTKYWHLSVFTFTKVWDVDRHIGLLRGISEAREVKNAAQSVKLYIFTKYFNSWYCTTTSLSSITDIRKLITYAQDYGHSVNECKLKQVLFSFPHKFI